MRHSLKGLATVLAFSGLLWLGWIRYKAFLNQGQRPSEGTQILNDLETKGVPDFTLKDIDGNLVTLSSFSNQIVIVNFWASWCDPCVAEFPSLVELIRHFKGKVVLLAVSADESLSDIQTFLQAFKADDPNIKVMWDQEKKLANQFGTKALPESYILGHDNRVIRKVAGVDNWFSEDAQMFFQELIETEEMSQTSEKPGGGKK